MTGVQTCALPISHMLKAMYLHLKKKYKEAEKEYLISESLDGENPELLYNMGLLYYNVKKYKKAEAYAKRAYGKGYQLPGLKNYLKGVGYW